ncbi:hypothetical protein [Cytobacillus horneckiae]|uniref:hypothetical protein n=1 Tax=Cytobacillus horneckiae TaxID=549687 RepID=UPI003D1E7539
MIREGAVVHIGKVGSHKWDEEYLEKYMAHTRPVEWLKHVPFNELNAEVQSLLKNIRTISKYKGDVEQSGLATILEKKDQTKLIQTLMIRIKSRY